MLLGSARFFMFFFLADTDVQSWAATGVWGCSSHLKHNLKLKKGLMGAGG